MKKDDDYEQWPRKNSGGSSYDSNQSIRFGQISLAYEWVGDPTHILQFCKYAVRKRVKLGTMKGLNIKQLKFKFCSYYISETKIPNVCYNIQLS